MLTKHVLTSRLKLGQLVTFCVRGCKPSKYSTGPTQPQMELVGHFSPMIDNSHLYTEGQMFVHKVFGYRGIVLYPWLANVYEKKKLAAEGDKGTLLPGNEQRIQNYYQVLMDMRDFPTNQNENAFVFTALDTDDKSSNLLDTIPGIDYVSHENLLPYKSSESMPIKHVLFDHFFELDDDRTSFRVSKLFKRWQEEHCNYLEIDKVYMATTDNIKVVIIPFYLGSRAVEGEDDEEHWWRYSVCIQNLSDRDITISERHWKIISNGQVKSARNLGEGDNYPVLNKKNPVYLNSSHISLKTDSGTVRGLLKVVLDNGKKLDIKTPTFKLESRCDFDLY